MTDQPAPLIVRHGERRGGPRRAEELTLHYAAAALLQAALTAAAEWDADPEGAASGPGLDNLVRVADAYLDAEAALKATRQP